MIVHTRLFALCLAAGLAGCSPAEHVYGHFYKSSFRA